MTTSGEPRFSLVVPVYDEEENVEKLLAEVAEVLLPHGPFEVIVVDDGSRDRSRERMREWKSRQGADWLRIVALARNSGQSAAVFVGVERARAEYVATLDGDLQNDPRDIPPMLARVFAGECDAVIGVRRRRQDSWLRRASSRVGNGVRNLVTGDQVTDAACGIKVFRRHLFLACPRFVGMHRFMATLARGLDARVLEHDVNHRPRTAGKAKYGIGNRAWRGLRDCFGVRWLRQRVLRYGVEQEY
jgi:glycosyltransferase involved in cell wall biosynthesis